jgi:hypothetical protein
MIQNDIDIARDYKGPKLFTKSAFNGTNSTPQDEFNYSDYRNTAIILDGIAQAIWLRKAEEEKQRAKFASPYKNLSYYNSKFKRDKSVFFNNRIARETPSRERPIEKRGE